MEKFNQCSYHVETNCLLRQIETLTFIAGSLQIHPLYIEYSLGCWGNISLSVALTSDFWKFIMLISVYYLASIDPDTQTKSKKQFLRSIS